MTRDQLIRVLERLAELSEEEGAALVSHDLLVEVLHFLSTTSSQPDFSHLVLVKTRSELKKAWQQLRKGEESIIEEIEQGFGRCLPFLETDRRVMFESLKARLVFCVREALELKVREVSDKIVKYWER